MNNRLSLWLGVGVILAISIFALTKISVPQQTENADQNPENGNTSVSLKDVSDTDNIKGVESAKVTIIEYSDFQCPACRPYFPVMNQIIEKYPEDVRIVYRHFPLRSLHKNAQLAAQAAEAAGNQDSFFKMHDELFKNQNIWSELSDPTDNFVAYAEKIGLDTDKFKTDMLSKETVKIVNDSYNEAVNMGLSGTPSFFINGKRITNPRGFEPFRQLINAELESLN